MGVVALRKNICLQAEEVVLSILGMLCDANTSFMVHHHRQHTADAGLHTFAAGWLSGVGIVSPNSLLGMRKRLHSSYPYHLFTMLGSCSVVILTQFSV